QDFLSYISVPQGAPVPRSNCHESRSVFYPTVCFHLLLLCLPRILVGICCKPIRQLIRIYLSSPCAIRTLSYVAHLHPEQGCRGAGPPIFFSAASPPFMKLTTARTILARQPPDVVTEYNADRCTLVSGLVAVQVTESATSQPQR